MDGLISLIVIIGIALISSSQKKKKVQQRSAKKARAFRDAAEVLDAPKPKKKAVSAEGWQELLSEMESMAQAAKPKAKPAEPMAKPAKPVPKQAAPVLHLENDDPEGSISTQGESAQEHARHRQKILAEEEQLRREHEDLQEIRSMNLEKLRTAVVMSEVLGKPVSLRRRGN